MVKPWGILGAIFAASAGAFIWGAIAFTFDREFAFVAWGIGAGVGMSSLLLGSRGVLNGVICAVLTLASIAVGKMLPYEFVSTEDLVYTYLDDWLDKDHYDEIILDAKAFEKVKAESEYPRYMVDRSYTDETKPADVGPDEVEYFKEEFVPKLR